MHLTTHGSLIALSDTTAGTTFILSSTDEVNAQDWQAATAALGVDDNYDEWDYAESGGFCVWEIQISPDTP
jgi:hypothetical protein